MTAPPPRLSGTARFLIRLLSWFLVFCMLWCAGVAFFAFGAVMDGDAIPQFLALIAGAVGSAICAFEAQEVAKTGLPPKNPRKVIIAGVLAVPGLVIVASFFRGFASAYDRPYAAALRADLRYLSELQHAHYDSTGRFVPDVAELPGPFRPSPGITLTFEPLDSASYRVIARHERLKEHCFIELRPGAPADPDCEGRFKRRQ